MDFYTFRKCFISFFLITSLSLQAFAECEFQEDELKEWTGKCETACAVATGTGFVGGIFAIATFGLSMIPCAGSCATAENFCRIMEEKKVNLQQCRDRCEEQRKTNARLEEEENLRRLKMEADAADDDLQVAQRNLENEVQSIADGTKRIADRALRIEIQHHKKSSEIMGSAEVAFGDHLRRIQLKVFRPIYGQELDELEFRVESFRSQIERDRNQFLRKFTKKSVAEILKL